MLEYFEIDISEGIDINKTNASTECDICHLSLNMSHIFTMVIVMQKAINAKAINFNDVAIVSDKGSDYRIYFWYMSKNDAINILNNSNLNKEMHYYKFFIIYKMNDKTTYFKNR